MRASPVGARQHRGGDSDGEARQQTRQDTRRGDSLRIFTGHRRERNRQLHLGANLCRALSSAFALELGSEAVCSIRPPRRRNCIQGGYEGRGVDRDNTRWRDERRESVPGHTVRFVSWTAVSDGNS
jgi:hypothetical protein